MNILVDNKVKIQISSTKYLVLEPKLIKIYFDVSLERKKLIPIFE